MKVFNFIKVDVFGKYSFVDLYKKVYLDRMYSLEVGFILWLLWVVFQ